MSNDIPPTAGAPIQHPEEPLTTGQIADWCGGQRWMVLAAIHRGLLEDRVRLGQYRVWYPSDMKRVREALIAGGYKLKPLRRLPR